VSVVTNAGKFFRAYLRDVRWGLEHPDGYATPPLTDILGHLANAGLELRLQLRAAVSFHRRPPFTCSSPV
jgi:hypothetical protein